MGEFAALFQFAQDLQAGGYGFRLCRRIGGKAEDFQRFAVRIRLIGGIVFPAAVKLFLQVTADESGALALRFQQKIFDTDEKQSIENQHAVNQAKRESNQRLRKHQHAVADVKNAAPDDVKQAARGNVKGAVVRVFASEQAADENGQAENQGDEKH